MLSLGMILEGLVAVLLVVTVGYCAVLDRRLRALRSGQDGLRSLIEALDGATARAQESVAALRGSSEVVGRTLDERVTRARGLADELALMIETANRLADRLEGGRERPARSDATLKTKAKGSEGTGERAGERPGDRLGERAPADWEESLLKALREAR